MLRLLLPLLLPLTLLFVWGADRGVARPVPAGGFAGAAVLLLLSGVLVLRRRRARTSAPRFDVLARAPALRRLVVHPATRPLAQLAFAVLFLALLAVGWFGDEDRARNPAPLLTWTVWWSGIVFVTLFVGKAWCYVCPWDAIAGWIEKPRLRPDARGPSAPGIGRRGRWPKRLRHLWLMVALFAGLTWIEGGLGLEASPRGTALVGVVMLSLTVGFALTFERRAFCRHVCSVGGVTGLFSLFGAAEVRTVDAEVCMACRTKDCYHGNQWGVGCPTDLFPAAFTENTHCINCLECVKTCPMDVMSLRARPLGTDLAAHRNPRLDEAVLVLVVLAFAMLPALLAMPAAASWRVHGLVPYGGALLAAAGVVGLVHAGAVALARRAAPAPTMRFGPAFVRLAYALVPLALFLHLARHLGPLVREGRGLAGMLAHPLGGEAAALVVPPAPLLSPGALWGCQVFLLLVGSAYSLSLVDRRAKELALSRLPLAAAVFAFGLASLWFLTP